MYVYAQRVYRVPYNFAKFAAALAGFAVALALSQTPSQYRFRTAMMMAALVAGALVLSLGPGRSALQTFFRRGPA